MALRQLNVWREFLDGVGIEINNWENPVRSSSFGMLKQNWTYYIYVHEEKCKDFEQLWLPDKLIRIVPTSPERLTHDYCYLPGVDELELHCGITFYEKGGQAVGHRYVKLGCDFSHLRDHERGYDFTLDEVYAEAKRSAELAQQTYYKQEEPATV